MPCAESYRKHFWRIFIARYQKHRYAQYAEPVRKLHCSATVGGRHCRWCCRPAPPEPVDQVGGGAVADVVSARIAVTPRPSRVWVSPVPAASEL
jgi:hypothetical protein